LIWIKARDAIRAALFASPGAVVSLLQTTGDLILI
jgi:hypothetical protein